VSNLTNCFSKCTGGNGKACFHLAQVFQKTESYYAQQAFAFGCAAGYHAACTNRGAGMRNGDYKDEPVRVWPEKKLNACLFRLFNTACKEDSGWGCVMLGQAYSLGEGVKKDLSKARAILLKICNSPKDDHPSCEYARTKLKQLNQ
jgi:TPR repeat protein